MSNYRQIALSVNSKRGSIVDPATGFELQNTGVSIYYGETVVLCVSFVDDNLNAVKLNASDSFECSLDSDYVHTTNGSDDPLMAYSGASLVDLSGDWDSVARESGRISIRLNCLTSGFLAKIGSSSSLSAYLEIKRISGGVQSVMCQGSITAKNVIRLDEGEPSSANPEYRSAAAQDSIDDAIKALIAAKASASDLSSETSTRASADSALSTAIAAKADASHTHTASQVSDFASVVASNSAVAANTAARHTHSNKATLDSIAALPNDSSKVLKGDGSWGSASTGSGTGNVTGPSSSTAGHVATFSTTDGTGIQDGGALGGAAALNVGTAAGTVAAGDHAHSGVYEPANSNIQTHISSTSNPHGVTASQVGLGNVQNVDQTNASNISSGTLPAARLPASGVTAGTVGGSSAVPVITYDAYGRITGVTTAAISGGSGSTSDTSRGSSTWNSTNSSPSQRAVEEALNDVGVEYAKRASSLAASCNGLPVSAIVSGYAAVTSGGAAKWTLANVLTDSFGSYALTNSGLTFATDSAFPLGSRYVATSAGSGCATFSDTGLPSGSASVSLCAWVKSSATGTYQTIMSYGTASSGHAMSLILTESGYAACSLNGSSTWLAGSTNIANGAWRHVCVAWNGSVRKLYVDGALVASDSTAPSTTLGAGRVGQWIDGTGALTGSLSDVRVYSRALTADEVASIYHGESGYSSKFSLPASFDEARRNIGAAPVDNGVCDGRLTLSSADDAPSSDITAASTLYFLPAKSLGKGNRVSLYDTTNSIWYCTSFSSVSASLSSLTASTNYDVFLYNSGTLASPTLALELVAWTDATTRATALYNLDGVYVKTGDYSRRYVGTIRTTSTAGQCEDSVTKRFVWNAQHRAKCPVRVTTSTASWTYSTATWRQANGDSTLQIAAVYGLPQAVRLDLQEVAESTGAGDNTYVGIGIDSTSSQSSYGLGGTVQMIAGGRRQPMLVSLDTTVAAGYHFFAWLEKGYGSNTQTFYGNMGGAPYYGITGSIER